MKSTISESNPETDYQEKMEETFVLILQTWADEEPEYLITSQDIFWLCVVMSQLELKRITGKEILKETLKNDRNCVLNNIKTKLILHMIPAGLSDEEFLTLIFAPPKLKIPPGHPYFTSLGVNNAAEWNALEEKRLPILAKHIDAHLKVLIRTARRAYEQLDNEPCRFEHKDKYYYTSRFSEIPESIIANLHTEDRRIEYLNDQDRLSQFWELAGVEMGSFTDGESRRILDLFTALDDIEGYGYSLASKKGISLKAYYGDRADSEKAQRQKLFKKIRENSNKTK